MWSGLIWQCVPYRCNLATSCWTRTNSCRHTASGGALDDSLPTCQPPGPSREAESDSDADAGTDRDRESDSAETVLLGRVIDGVWRRRIQMQRIAMLSRLVSYVYAMNAIVVRRERTITAISGKRLVRSSGEKLPVEMYTTGACCWLNIRCKWIKKFK